MVESAIKNIVITGASSGIGAALARAYAAPGIVLGLVGRHPGRLNAIVSECRTNGAYVYPGLVDVADEAAICNWICEFDHLYPIDLVIANAGISAGTGGSGEALSQVKNIFSVNLDGVLNTVHPIMEEMKKRRHGQIALLSSMASFRGSPTAPAYSASKAAIRIYGQALQGALQADNITVSVICPGFIKTPMTQVNRFPMPFLLDADRAATKIKAGLDKKKANIIFPLPLAVMARLQNMMPDRLVNALYRRLPAKPEFSHRVE